MPPLQSGDALGWVRSRGRSFFHCFRFKDEKYQIQLPERHQHAYRVHPNVF
jgi:hypothetical protein